MKIVTQMGEVNLNVRVLLVLVVARPLNVSVIDVSKSPQTTFDGKNKLHL